ncbi:developmental regulatory protein [Colletotrichum musicola]|uniref:Developmental regulatory protein n=1 Tax=Colletotrichum musicola TaxID=2175873 RepID=A0A8H6KN41_9PEZI|nr:developmental regulatory protein [Colletotrichum musicola]
MTAAVSHWTRSPGTSVRPSSHPKELDGEMTYLGVQFAVEPMDKDGNGGSAHLPWEGVTAAETAGPAGAAAGRGLAAAVAVDEGLLFEEFVDLERLSTDGDDELAPAPLPDSFFFNMSLPTHGSGSTTSVSGDLDELLDCHQLQPPPMETKTSASSAGPGPTSTSSEARAPQAMDVPELETSWPIQRPEGVRVGRGQQQRKALTYPDTACPGGPKSISTSELLRLEGISLKASPSRAHSVTASHPPTPLLQSSSATSSNTNLHLAGSSNTLDTTNNHHVHNGGRKPSNFFKAVASKLQQKAASVRHKQPNNNMSSVAVDSSGPMSPNVNAPPRKDFKLRPEYVNVHGLGTSPTTRLPLSPPNSATLPPDLSQTSSAGSNGMTSFVGGYLEDPFTNINNINNMFRPSDPTTPMDTPILDDNRGMFNSYQQMSSSNVANTSKATWPMTTTTPHTDNHAAWANHQYSTADGLENQWWDGGNMDLSANSQYQAQNARNASFNLAMHTQQNDLAYEYNPLAGAGSEMSGLMIHMPQPQPRATSSPVNHYQPQQLHHHQPHGAPQQMTDRRPRMPRAPSAGARHMCLTTPMRKTRNPGSRQASRESSTSPTPTNRHSSSGSLGSIGGGGALSASVKKRRSWQQNRRTPSIGSGLGGGGASEGMGFVNFTPSDKNILMTGVAPSGSSKTKARREKEAMEKRRRLSEAAIKAVKAAGGDVEKFVEEGFFAP